MYACVCSAVTVSEVNDAIDSGASSIDEVGDITCAGDSCGTCHSTIEELIASKCGTCPAAMMSVA